MTLDTRKSTIIRKVQLVNENWLLKSIEKLLSDIEVDEPKEKASLSEDKGNDFSFYVGNLEESVDLAKIKLERPLRKLDRDEFNSMSDALEWDQSIDELLKDLGE